MNCTNVYANDNVYYKDNLATTNENVFYQYQRAL